MEDARIRRAIIDKNVVIPEGYEVGFDPEGDRKKFTVTDTGIVVIAKNSILPEEKSNTCLIIILKFR